MKIIFLIDTENFSAKLWVVLKILQVINSPKYVGITENYLCFHRVRKAPQWSRAGYDVSLFKRIVDAILSRKCYGNLFSLTLDYMLLSYLWYLAGMIEQGISEWTAQGSIPVFSLLFLQWFGDIWSYVFFFHILSVVWACLYCSPIKPIISSSHFQFKGTAQLSTHWQLMSE